MAAAVIKHYIWEDMDGDEEVFEATAAVKFRIVRNENKAELKSSWKKKAQ